MKKIGIIGGMAPDSTLLYYKYIINEYRKRFKDHKYPEIIIYSVNFQKFIDFMDKNRWDAIAEELIKNTHRLEKAGADFALIATNTMHIVFQDVLNNSPIPLLSIVDSVAQEVKNFGIETVGLLGTLVTMEKDFYRKGLSSYNIHVLIPESEDRHKINEIIFNELTQGKITQDSKNIFLRIIDNLVKKGAEGIILGCTEIPLLINQNDIEPPLFDSTYIHARSALEYALH